MACMQSQQSRIKNKNFIELLQEIKITGIKPVINIISYWSNELEGEESRQLIEFISRDGRHTEIGLQDRAHNFSSSDESMALERRKPRKRALPQRLIDDNDEAEASLPPAPTQQVSLIKLKDENSVLKSKIKVLEDKCKDLENERDFLRSSLTNALSTKEEMQGASKSSQNLINPDSSDEDSSDLPEEKKKVKRRKKEKKQTNKKIKVDSSSSSDDFLSTSDSSVSSSSPKKRKHKKKSRKTAKHMKKSKRVFLPEDAIQRYKKVLQYLKQGMTKTLAYHKCEVDRKTIVDTAAIAELEVCDPEAYKTLREKFHRGQKLSEFANQCKEMCAVEPLRTIIEAEKKNGMLIDLCQKKK